MLNIIKEELLVLNIFKSKRQKIKESADEAFNRVIDSFKGMDATEIAAILDMAAHIKESSLSASPGDNVYQLAFNDPLLLDEEKAFYYLDYWTKTIKSRADGYTGQAFAGAMSIWWLSLAACTISELRFRGRELWGLLEEGFMHVSYPFPSELIPKGLEPKEHKADVEDSQNFKTAKIALELLSSQISLAYDEENLQGFQKKLYSIISRGYIFGFTDAILQLSGTESDGESLAIITMVFQEIYGQEVFIDLITLSLSEQDDPKFNEAKKVGILELLAFTRERSPPQGLFKYLVFGDLNKEL